VNRPFASVIVNGLLIGLTFVSLFPLLWMLSVSFMAAGEASTLPPPLLPNAPTFANYRELFERGGMLRYFTNSLLLATSVTLISLVFNAMAGQQRLFKVLIGTVIIPGQVAMMPLFLLLKQMGLVNTYGGVIVPAMAGVFGIFLVRQYALSIPDELLEAARMDGAGEFRIFASIILPLLAPILASLAIFTFLGCWNDFMWPLIVLTDAKLQTLPVALASLSREHAQDSEMMMAGSVVTVLPVLVVFLGLQKFYIRGLLAGSVKG
jgi:multiple sugar transport system permease protein